MKKTFKRECLILTVSFFCFTGSTVLAQPAQPENNDGLIPEMAAFEKIHSDRGEHQKLAKVLKKALGTYEEIRDYKAIFTKSELSKGVLGLEEQIYLKFEKPWKIYMGWLNTEKQGLQVVYERGKHDGKLAIHKPGLLLGFAPVIFLEQNSPWVREGSASYNIEDAGIGSFLHDFTRVVLKAGRENKLEVLFHGAVKEEGYGGEKFEVTFKDPGSDPDYFAHRIVTVFDEKSTLPVYMQLFDAQNIMTGVYSYNDLKINVGKDDPDFKKQIDRQLLKVYEEESVVRKQKNNFS